MKNNTYKGIILLLITAIIWGGSFISQLFGGVILGEFTFNTYRCLFGCISVFVMIVFDNIYNHRHAIFFRKDEDAFRTIKNSFFCGFVLFFAMITQQIGVQQTTTAKAGLIAGIEVICVPILMFLFYKRIIRFITWIFIVTAMIGIMMLSSGLIDGINIGDVWVFISTILYSITIIQVSKYAQNIDPYKFSFFRFFIIFLMSLVCAIVFRENSFTIAKFKQTYVSILYSGILASGVAYTFQILGQKYCEPVIATLLMSLEGIFAAVLGWIILGQKLNWFQILGIIVTFISIVFVQITDYHTEVKKLETTNLDKYSKNV